MSKQKQSQKSPEENVLGFSRIEVYKYVETYNVLKLFFWEKLRTFEEKSENDVDFSTKCVQLHVIPGETCYLFAHLEENVF